MPPSKPEDLDYVKTLIFSDIGLGKTTFLGTANLDPRTAPIAIADFEGGTRSLKGLDPAPDIWRIRSWDDFDDFYAEVSDPDTKYRSIAIDSTSEVHMYSLFAILAEEREDRIKKKQRTDALQEADFGRSLIQLRRFLRSFRDIDRHVFFTALKMEAMDPGYGLVNKPSFMGKLANEVGMLCDVVGGMTWLPSESNPEKMKRALLLKEYPDWKVKIRTDFHASDVPNEIYDPTVTKLFDLLNIAYPE